MRLVRNEYINSSAADLQSYD